MRIHWGGLRSLPIALQVLFIPHKIIGFITYLKTYRPPTTDDPILACLSQADLIAYSRTCKHLYKTVSSYNKRAFKIDLFLGALFV